MDRYKYLYEKEFTQEQEEQAFVSFLNETKDSDMPYGFPVDKYDIFNFINIIKKYKDLILNHKSKINFCFTNTDIEKAKEIICGTVFRWNDWEDFNSVEYYYSHNNVMRSVYAINKNNMDEKNKDVCFYVVIKNKRYVVKWTTDKDNDMFNYTCPSIEQIGLAEILWDIFGGEYTKNGRLYNKIGVDVLGLTSKIHRDILLNFKAKNLHQNNIICSQFADELQDKENVND